MKRVEKLRDHLLSSSSPRSNFEYADGSNNKRKIGTFGMNKTKSEMPPFHLAFPVHDLDLAKEFYGTVLGCSEGRSAPNSWIDYSLFGHQIVCHYVGKDYRTVGHYNPVDNDQVPVPHFGAALSVDDFHALAKRLKEHNVKFVIEPHLRFKGAPGEQWTMFFHDPTGNALEFKAMVNPENLFAKYTVKD